MVHISFALPILSGELLATAPPPDDTMEDKVLRRAGGRWRVEEEVGGVERWRVEEGEVVDDTLRRAGGGFRVAEGPEANEILRRIGGRFSKAPSEDCAWISPGNEALEEAGREELALAAASSLPSSPTS